mgnify:CR=1 FL=1
MKWLIIIIVLSMVVFYACTPTKKPNKTAAATSTTTTTTTTTTESTTAPTIEQQLEGSWLMHKYVCCGRKRVEEMGRGIKKPKQLVFAANNQVTIKNLRTQESKTTTYQLETKKEGTNPPITYIILGTTMPKKGIVRFEGTELVLDYQYMDLQQEFYRKAK